MAGRLLVFALSGRSYALDLNLVSEVIEPPRHYPVPRVPAPFLGLINFHGALVLLLDTALFLGIGVRRETGKVVIIDPKSAGLALWIDDVVCFLPEEAVLSRDAAEAPFVSEELQTGIGAMGLVDLEALLAALEEGVNG